MSSDFIKGFFIHTHTQLLAKWYGQSWLIWGQILFFTHFSILPPSKDPHRPKKGRGENQPVDLTSKILTAVFVFFLFKNARIVKAKWGIYANPQIGRA